MSRKQKRPSVEEKDDKNDVEEVQALFARVVTGYDSEECVAPYASKVYGVKMEEWQPEIREFVVRVVGAAVEKMAAAKKPKLLQANASVKQRFEEKEWVCTVRLVKYKWISPEYAAIRSSGVRLPEIKIDHIRMRCAVEKTLRRIKAWLTADATYYTSASERAEKRKKHPALTPNQQATMSHIASGLKKLRENAQEKIAELMMLAKKEAKKVELAQERWLGEFKEWEEYFEEARKDPASYLSDAEKDEIYARMRDAPVEEITATVNTSGAAKKNATMVRKAPDCDHLRPDVPFFRAPDECAEEEILEALRTIRSQSHRRMEDVEIEASGPPAAPDSTIASSRTRAQME